MPRKNPEDDPERGLRQLDEGLPGQEMQIRVAAVRRFMEQLKTTADYLDQEFQPEVQMTQVNEQINQLNVCIDELVKHFPGRSRADLLNENLEKFIGANKPKKNLLKKIKNTLRI